MKIKFIKERETKNTIRFAEVPEGEETIVGTIYVPKATLKSLGWAEGKNLVIELGVE